MSNLQCRDNAEQIATPDREPAAGARAMRHRLGNAAAVLLTTGLAIGVVVVAVTALHSRAAKRAGATANPVITVATERVTWADHYTIKRGFVGRLEAARDTALAFEREGLVIAITFDEGDLVKKGAVVARLDSAKLSANRRALIAQRRELEAQRDLAKLTMSRQNKLQSRGWSPQQRYDEARFSVARLDAAIARVEAAIQALDVDLRKSELKAPFDGTVAARNLDEGAVVGAGTTVLRLLETANQRARIGVSPEAAKSLTIGDAYTLRTDGERLNASLKALRSDIETQSRTVTALFTLAGQTKTPLGELAVLELERRIDARGFWVPLSALVEGRKGLWTVMLADETGKSPTIRREAVEVLHVAAGRAFVRGALSDGDKVVTKGTNRITPGQRVVLARFN